MALKSSPHTATSEVVSIIQRRLNLKMWDKIHLTAMFKQTTSLLPLTVYLNHLEVGDSFVLFCS